MNAYGVGLGVPQTRFEGEARAARTPREALCIRFGRFELDEANALLMCDGKALNLPPKPFEVLCALARRPGLLVTKNDLLDEVWGHRFVSESVLKTVIGKLRIALQDDARNPRFIETAPRRGYRFIAPAIMAADRADGSDTGYRPHVPPTPLDVTGSTAERTLREIREMLRLLVEQPHAGHGAAARLMDYLAAWTPDTVSEGR